MLEVLQASECSRHTDPDLSLSSVVDRFSGKINETDQISCLLRLGYSYFKFNILQNKINLISYLEAFN